MEDVKLDLLFNNAGMKAAEGFWAPSASGEQIRVALLQARDEDWAKVFAVNVGSLQVGIVVLLYPMRSLLTSVECVASGSLRHSYRTSLPRPVTAARPKGGGASSTTPPYPPFTSLRKSRAICTPPARLRQRACRSTLQASLRISVYG